MKIIFLGTSSGKASLKRNHSSILLLTKNYNLLIDAGDGISRSLLQNRIDFNFLNGILFTHLHPDHYSGLPALIVQMKMIKRVSPLDIFIYESMEKAIREFLLFSYLLPERMDFNLHFKTFRDDERFCVTDNLSFLAKKNSHLSELEEYKTKYPDLSFYSASFLFELPNKKIIYTSDIGSKEDLLIFDSVNPDIFISEVTHINIEDLLEKIEKINPTKVYLTHYSDEEFSRISEILTNLSITPPLTVQLAKDGLSFEF